MTALTLPLLPTPCNTPLGLMLLASADAPTGDRQCAAGGFARNTDD